MPVERYASEYNMNHAKRGIALVFNHEHFDMVSLKSRTGTNVDCENLCDTLRGLHFEVSMYKDLRSADIQHEIQTGELFFVFFIKTDLKTLLQPLFSGTYGSFILRLHLSSYFKPRRDGIFILKRFVVQVGHIDQLLHS